jgi:ABC-type sugar transport system ATPase subunit
MVFQSYALYPHMTVRENMAFSLTIRKRPPAEIEAAVQEASRMLELDALLDRYPAELSGGQRQRVAMGRAVVRHPSTFLFDEPLSNLDPALRAHMRVELKRLHRRLGATIVHVTHDQVEAMTLADRIVVLHGGRVQQVGSPSELFDHPANTFVARFIGSPPMNLLPAAPPPGASAAWLGDVVPAGLPPGAQVGVRPTDLHLADDGRWSVTVDVVERLGHEVLLHVLLDGAALTVHVPEPAPWRAGDALRVTPTRIHLFDAEGRRLADAP